jgi:hypothetical protein
MSGLATDYTFMCRKASILKFNKFSICVYIKKKKFNMSVVLTFGKHKGTSVQQIAETKYGRGLLKYYLKWDGLEEKFRLAIEEVLAVWEAEDSLPPPTPANSETESQMHSNSER